MKKSHFNGEFLVLFGPIINRFFACSNEEKNKPKQQRVRALVLPLWEVPSCWFSWSPPWLTRPGCGASQRSSRCAHTWTAACPCPALSLSTTTCPPLASAASTAARRFLTAPLTSRASRSCLSRGACDEAWRGPAVGRPRWPLLAAGPDWSLEKPEAGSNEQ